MPALKEHPQNVLQTLPEQNLHLQKLVNIEWNILTNLVLRPQSKLLEMIKMTGTRTIVIQVIKKVKKWALNPSGKTKERLSS